MENINLLERYYQPFLKEKEDYSNTAYKTLEKNGVDNSPLLGIEEPGAGNIEFDKDEKVNAEDEKSFLKGLADFAVDLPKDAFLSAQLSLINGADLSVNLVPTINKMFGAINPNYQRILNATDLDDKLYADMKSVSDSLNDDRNKIYEQLDDTNTGAQLLGMIVQDLPYAVPSYKFMKKMGVPSGFALPISVGIGAAAGYSPDQSFLVNSETVKNFKELVKALPDTPEEEVLDRTFMALEGGFYGKAIPLIGNALKYVKKNVPQFNTSVGGAASTTAVADSIGNNIISNKTEKE
jgi:hypothetical protein